MRSATASATAVLPPAVGPKIAMTLGALSEEDIAPGPPRASLQFQPTEMKRAGGARSVSREGQAVTRADWVPRSVADVAPSMRTSTSLPGLASPAKLTVVFLRVRPRSVEGSVRLGP